MMLSLSDLAMAAVSLLVAWPEVDSQSASWNEERRSGVCSLVSTNIEPVLTDNAQLASTQLTFGRPQKSFMSQVALHRTTRLANGSIKAIIKACTISSLAKAKTLSLEMVSDI